MEINEIEKVGVLPFDHIVDSVSPWCLTSSIHHHVIRDVNTNWWLHLWLLCSSKLTEPLPKNRSHFLRDHQRHSPPFDLDYFLLMISYFHPPWLWQDQRGRRTQKTQASRNPNIWNNLLRGPWWYWKISETPPLNLRMP